MAKEKKYYVPRVVEINNDKELSGKIEKKALSYYKWMFNNCKRINTNRNTYHVVSELKSVDSVKIDNYNDADDCNGVRVQLNINMTWKSGKKINTHVLLEDWFVDGIKNGKDYNFTKKALFNYWG